MATRSPHGSTILLRPETRARPDAVKIHPQETYEEALNRLLNMAYDPEPLSVETLQKIGGGIVDIRAGRCRPFDEVVREQGLE
ncbi:MAG: hypothetical protein KA818_04545 [Methanoculleus sp.]|jgi:hypothetical protein|nr:hypothetical protein [Methanoculleus sp. 10]MBP7410799.1 hypothetical protein [Methanoculleus sp.]HPX74130.1 hypothetical protein [Methanoregulaceae archaeon]